MKILFINPLNEPFKNIVSASNTPWATKLNSRRNIKKLDCVYPTGLLSIGAYLKKHLPDEEIKILDFNVAMNKLAEDGTKDFTQMSREEFFSICFGHLSCFEPDLIGISALFCGNYCDLEPLAAFCSKRFAGKMMISGGHLAAAVYKTIFSAGSSLDAIAFGEGEIPILELCEAMREHRSAEYLAESPCWITGKKLSETPDFRPELKLIENLDEIPPFDFNMLILREGCFSSVRCLFANRSTDNLNEMFLFSSRGCPYRCVFCASQKVHGHKVRFYSKERFKQDILHFKKLYGISRFVIYDDHFLVKKDRAIEILNFIVDQGLHAEISSSAFFAIDDDVAQTMYRAGIREAGISLESGNEETLRNIMHKPANLKRAEEAVAALHRNGIMAISNILIGLPGETPESIEKGVQYLMTTNVNWFQCFVTAPLPGSELFDDCVKNGYLVGDNPFVMDFKKCIIRTPDFEPEYIERKAYEMNLLLNFVNNYDYRVGNYEAALNLFERILNTVISTHAFAYYFAAKCCLKLELQEKYARYKKRYEEMVGLYPFWKKWVDFFHLPPLSETIEPELEYK